MAKAILSPPNNRRSARGVPPLGVRCGCRSDLWTASARYMRLVCRMRRGRRRSEDVLATGAEIACGLILPVGAGTASAGSGAGRWQRADAFLLKIGIRSFHCKETRLGGCGWGGGATVDRADFEWWENKKQVGAKNMFHSPGSPNFVSASGVCRVFQTVTLQLAQFSAANSVAK